jgi:type VI secretion system protein ImpJ
VCLARFLISECEVKDNNSGADGRVPLQIGKLKTRLLLEREERSGFTCLGLGRVREMSANKTVELDSDYIPPNMNSGAMPNLGAFMRELNGILSGRAEMLAADLVKPSHSTVPEITDFMILQMINRYQPVVNHLSTMEGLHPEDFYRVAIQIAGEISTFFREGKRPVVFPKYNHDDLQGTFIPVMEDLRDLLARDRMRRAIRIPLSKPKAGVYGARLPDINLLDTAVFILAARAQVSSEMLRTSFPPQVKIGPVEEIQQLVASHLRGIPIEPLPVAPKEIPYHADFTYFRLNRFCDHWKKMKTSGGFAIWIGGAFPDLDLEFWAIKEG